MIPKATANKLTKNAKISLAANDLLIAAKGALAALNQNKTYPADIKAAKSFLEYAIKKATE